MSYLLFMDESGHDHKTMPYEVRGGIALPIREVWPTITSIRNLEREAFGGLLHELGSELKGERLFRTKNIRFADQEPELPDVERREGARRFLSKATRSHEPNRREFTAYGQACRYMAARFFEVLADHQATIFASMVPRGAHHGIGSEDLETVRKDQESLFDRYFRFLEEKDSMGLLVLDETDRTDDRRYLRRMENYFSKSDEGRLQATRIVPAPMFVASEMSHAIQAADVVIYCINWGYRSDEEGIDAETREDIEKLCSVAIQNLQYRSAKTLEDGSQLSLPSIFCVSELYKKKKARPLD